MANLSHLRQIDIKPEYLIFLLGQTQSSKRRWLLMQTVITMHLQQQFH